MTTEPQRTGTSASSAPTRALAAFAAGLRVDAIPVRTRERMKDLLLDALASALAGHEDPQGARVLSTARAVMGPGSARVIGGERLSPAGATLANGYLITSATLCDIHYPSSCHVSPEVVPPALAIAGERDATGRELLVALTAGFELTTRIGVGLHFPVFHARGWHSPGIIGVLGGAAAAGLLLGLDETRLVHALGIAGSQASGTDGQHGTPTIKYHQSHGALAALLGAQLASTGFTALQEILVDPKGGLYVMHSDGGDPAAALDGLGERWELESISLRPWPLPTLLLNVVGTVIEIVRETDLAPTDVERLRITMSATALKAADGGFDTPRRAQTSGRYLAAVALHDRRCWTDQLAPARLADPLIGEFAHRRVDLLADPSLNLRGVHVEVLLRDGRTVSRARSAPHGEPPDPCSRDEVVAKLRRAAVPVIGEAKADIVIDAITSLEAQRSVRPLLDALGA